MEEHFNTIPAQEEAAATQPADPSLAIDIRKNEFIAFSLLQAKLYGPLRRRGIFLGISVCVGLLSAVLLLWDWHTMGAVDLPLLITTLLLLLPSVVFLAILPLTQKRKAANLYDRRVEALGNAFYGVLTVYPDRVEKENGGARVSTLLNAHTQFVETEELLLFFNRYNPTIVIPARCMTQEMTMAVRSAADRLPTANRVFIARFCPKGEVVPPPAVQPVPEKVLWEQEIEYKPEEAYRAARPMIIKRFWRLSPFLSAGSLMIGYMLGWDGSGKVIPFIVCFLLSLGVLSYFNLAMPLNRLKRMCQQQNTRFMTMHFRITEKMFYYKANDFGETGLLWSEIDHVYDKDDMVEVDYKGASLYIPKRCIDDLDAFDAIIRQCREKQKV